MSKKEKKAQVQHLTLDYVRSLVPLDMSKIGVLRTGQSKVRSKKPKGRKK
ncbi:hypothetical protein [Paraburkholderia sp. UCT31]|nr:hypothetical protein [Paraburkholderia sp. UCT31]